MNANYPIETLAAALHHACLVGLDPTKVEQYKYENMESGARGLKKVPTGEFKDVRPTPYHCEVTMFAQSWSSTALGFGGIGGQAFTGAYTVIVEGPQCDYCVYFGSRLAYHIRRPTRAFFEDMANRSMVEVSKAGKYREPA